MSRAALTRRASVILGTAACLGVLATGIVADPQQPQNRTPPPPQGRNPETRSQTGNADTGDIETLPVQREVYLIAGAGGNIAVHVGPEGLVVVDTGDGRRNDQVLAALRRVSSTAPVRFIINTSADPDHTGGNEAISKALGEELRSRETSAIEDAGAAIVAQENVLNRMSAPTGKQSTLPIGAWPTSTYFTPKKDLYMNNQAVQIMHQPAAHTDGDSLVYFRASDVIITGDIFDKTRYPVIDKAKGGSIGGVVDALNRLLEITVAAKYEEGGTMVIPGHGRMCDEADVVEYRDMVTIVRDRIQDLVKKGRTLEQVKAAKPTMEYDPMYGATTGPWTTDMFVETVYRDLVAERTH